MNAAVAKLTAERDTLKAERDQLRERVIAAETAAARAQGEIDGLRQALATRDQATLVQALTTERDALRERLEAKDRQLSECLVRAVTPATVGANGR